MKSHITSTAFLVFIIDRMLYHLRSRRKFNFPPTRSLWTRVVIFGADWIRVCASPRQANQLPRG